MYDNGEGFYTAINLDSGSMVQALEIGNTMMKNDSKHLYVSGKFFRRTLFDNAAISAIELHSCVEGHALVMYFGPHQARP